MATEETPQQVRPFAAFLTELNQGRTHSKLSDEHRELLAAVLATGKKGTYTLTVTIEADDTETGRVTITAAVTAKRPAPTAKKNIYWVDGDGNSVRTDPNQMALGDLRDATGFYEKNQERHA